MNGFFAQLGRLLARYTIGQRIVIFAVGLSVLSAAIAMVVWANRPEYDLMYSGLEPSNASAIVSELRGMKVNFKLGNNGRDIYVPQDQVSELRLRFTSQGYANAKVPGYEIFDNSKIGMTTFMQQLNMRRALEGELIKTINEFPEVRNSRVHLVLPEDKLFEKDRKGSASVVLYLKAGHSIKAEQVDGISALVANSVKGIDADNVVVIDSEGNRLNDTADKENTMGAAGTQWDLRHREEMKVQKKVTDIVENVVGLQNAVVRVSLDMNFEQVERNSDLPDPESVVVVSEETRTETQADQDSLNANNKNKRSENTLTNYEIGKIQEHFVGNTGVINKLSVAVLVNGTKQTVTDASGKKTIEIKPRSARELEQIAALVRSAVGYDANRGDVVQVENISFDTSAQEEDMQYFADADKKELYSQIINKGLLVIGLIVGIFFMRSLLKNSQDIFNTGSAALGSGVRRKMVMAPDGTQMALPEVEEEPEEQIDEDIFMKKLSPEAQARLRAKDKMMTAVVDYAKDEPESSAKIIRSWLTKQNNQN